MKKIDITMDCNSEATVYSVIVQCGKQSHTFEFDSYKKALKLFESIIKKGNSKNSNKSTVRATEVRSQQTKDKIQNAINLMRLENKKFTHYSISKESGVSYNAVKKHIPNLDILK